MPKLRGIRLGGNRLDLAAGEVLSDYSVVRSRIIVHSIGAVERTIAT